MAIRCSLLGHDYGETETERDRVEEGSEVVVTVREFRECRRCGDRDVQTENKEVTTMASRDGDDPDGSGDSEFVSPDVVESAAAEDPAPDPPRDAADEGAEIIDDDSEGGRDPGEWPEAETTHPADADGIGEEPTAWPEHDAPDEGYDAEPADGGVELDDDLAPEASADADETVEYIDADAGPNDAGSTAGAGTGIKRAESAPRPDAQSVDAVTDTEFSCPECGFVEPVAGSSLRAGDICPECRRGYLSQRRR